MSCKINSVFAIRDMKIMEDTLKKMGYSYEKRNNKLVIDKSYNSIVIDEKGISCDSANTNEVGKMKVEYSKTFAYDFIGQRGEMYHDVEETAEEVTIFVN